MKLSATVFEINAFQKKIRPGPAAAPLAQPCSECPYKMLVDLVGETRKAIRAPHEDHSI